MTYLNGRKLWLLLLVGVLSTVISGCQSGPTDDDIVTAVKGIYEGSNRNLTNIQVLNSGSLMSDELNVCLPVRIHVDYSIDYPVLHETGHFSKDFDARVCRSKGADWQTWKAIIM